MSAGQRRPAIVSEPLTEEQEAWVERGMKVVMICAKKHIREPGTSVMYEELLSLGTLGLMQAARTYRRDAGVDFEVYCYKRVDGAMRYGKKKDRQFYALMWDAAYAHLEATRDDGPSLDDEPGSDDAALHEFSDRLLTAVSAKLCGAATKMVATMTEEAHAARDEWVRKLRILTEELADTPSDGAALLRLVYDDDMDLKNAGRSLGLTYGQARRLHERTLDDLGGRVRRRCSFDPA